MRYSNLFIFILFLWACGSNPDQPAERTNGYSPELKTPEDSLFHDVMEGHDAAMARTGLLSKYLSRVQHDVDSIRQLPVEKTDVLYLQELQNLQNELKEAEKGMNAWMDAFKVDSAKEDTEKRLRYLRDEKEKIYKVKESILRSLQKADSLFNK